MLPLPKKILGALIVGIAILSIPFASPRPAAAAECRVDSATISPSTARGNYKKEFLGTLYEIKDAEQRKVSITVVTADCVGKNVYVSLTQFDKDGHPRSFANVVGEVLGSSISESSWLEDKRGNPNVPALDKKEIKVTDDTFTISMYAGVNLCTTNDDGADCRYGVRVGTTKERYERNSRETGGNLDYDCPKAICAEPDWEYVKIAQKDPNKVDVVDNKSGMTTPDACTGKDCYSLFSGFADALGGKLSTIGNADSLGEFINAIIGFMVGIGGVLAVIMIMYQGFLYMKTENTNTKSETKSRIINTVVGFVLLLSIYVILRTINPDLLNLTPGIESVALNSGVQLSSDQFQKITGESLGDASQYDALAKQVAKDTNSDYCALRVIIQNETRGNAGLIGQDENAPFDGVASRRAFVASGQKYSGATFSSSGNLITNRKFCNDAAGCAGSAPAPTSPTLGLDWRFSKGIGLTQITFFPDDYNKFSTSGYVPKASNKNVVPKRTFTFTDGTITVSAFDVFKPEKNLEISAKLWNAGIAKCQTAQGAFYTYACGSCSCKGSFAQNEVSERTSQYNTCKKNNP